MIEIPTLTPLLKRQNSEFLINFMYDFVLRTHTQEPFQNDIIAIFGDVPNTGGLTPKEKEAHLIGQYRDRLKEIAPDHGGVPRTAVVPILYSHRDRTLYHLVYLTRHPKGIVVFMEASEKLELVQRKVRAQAKQENRESRTGQPEFSFMSCGDVQIEEKADPEDVKAYWMRQLTNQPRQFGTEQLADMLEETGWFESDFQLAFGSLVKEGRVANQDDHTNRRRTKFVHFGDGENLIRIKQ